MSAPNAPVKAATPAIALTTSDNVKAAPENKPRIALGDAQIDKRSPQLSPQNLAENEYRDAANLLGQGRVAEAQDGFRLALQNNPGHIGARQALFGLLVEARRTSEAEQVLQEGLRINPNQAGFAMALARMQVDRGDTNGAIETMLKPGASAQASPDYLAFLAALYQRTSQHKEAVEEYQAALRLAPQSGVWLMGLGISLQALKRNAEAQEAFRRARSSNSLNPELTAFVDQRLKQLQ
jgi:MSHA biogenesis protein MshN